VDKVSHVLVCLNVDCKSRGAVEVMQELSRRLAEKGCNDVAVKSYMCFGACQAGPNLVLHPEHTWYSGVRVDDLDEIVNHILGGSVVERLADKVDPSLRMLIYQLLDAGLF
jgi:(2Fe-2S) ferredoxin